MSLRPLVISITLLASTGSGCTSWPPASGLASSTAGGDQTEPVYTAFRHSQRVTIRGYQGDAMEPFITRDDRYLFFNNRNDPAVNTNLHYAVRIDDVTFDYRGEIAGANSSALDGVPTMAADGTLCFVSTRSYDQTLSTLYCGRFADGTLTDVALLDGVSARRRGRVNFDVEISADGRTLWFVDGVFSGRAMPDAADLAIAVCQASGCNRLAESATILRAINTPALEYAAAISSDGLELFFTRVATRPAIYRAARLRADEPFGAPARVSAIEGFAEAPTVSADGRALYYHRRENERFEIYRVTR